MPGAGRRRHRDAVAPPSALGVPRRGRSDLFATTTRARVAVACEQRAIVGGRAAAIDRARRAITSRDLARRDARARCLRLRPHRRRSRARPPCRRASRRRRRCRRVSVSRSRVVPGMSVTIARAGAGERVEQARLPTFGRPTIATVQAFADQPPARRRRRAARRAGPTMRVELARRVAGSTK